MKKSSYLFVAVHKGPYLSIQPIEEELGSGSVIYLVDGIAREERKLNALPFVDMELIEDGWGTLEKYIRQTEIKVIVRSSSEDVSERNVEGLASEAAKAVGIPVVVVEDYPGNYRFAPHERLDRLFIEHASLIQLHESRGMDSNYIYITGNPRYNELTSVDSGKRRTATRAMLGIQGERVLLWAGQPDGENSYMTLERIFDSCIDGDVLLIFRAHPRDPIYASGRYQDLLSRCPKKVVDMTKYRDVIDLYCAADLVATQFSSAGAEAGHLGVPSLFVLFDDLGKTYLRSFKGYDLPPWCSDGCSFLIEAQGDVRAVLEEALFNDRSREAVISNFKQKFSLDISPAKAIAAHIRHLSDASPDTTYDA